ncbi:conserved membrane hypothetical protein [uncultured Desulfobacterium sp.]|uniref:Uncharacterized protein n=1 Tax=uncultured Desulfobacterium sp. TaxID=201089 RepID=A0A445MXQ6_9BACT|nr:conserved membrane hypothetical protein [uncultured Desulfobacterium sp.]
MDMKTFDAYSLRARYFPTVIVIAPICLVILSLTSDIWGLKNSIGFAAISALGLAFVMDQVGRDQGKKKEARLFHLWDGKPTTRILRHRDTSLDRTTRERYHNKLARFVEGINIPTAEQELKDPNEADSIYNSCVAYLRAKTRDPKIFPLVFQENVNYGFRRNLWGMKPAGICISVIGVLACSALSMHYFFANEKEWVGAAVCVLLCISLLVLWVARFTPSWVKITADEYAKQLVSACDTLDLNKLGSHK